MQSLNFHHAPTTTTARLRPRERWLTAPAPASERPPAPVDAKKALVPLAFAAAPTADEAMGRYAAGDDLAFECVYDEVAPRLAAYLQRRLRDRTRVEDLIQQTFLHMHRARGSFIPGAQVLPWALSIARRLLIDGVRRGDREIPVDTDCGDEVPALMEGIATGEELLAARQTADTLERALAGLSEPQRAAFELVKGEGLSLAQAARVLGTTVLGVKLRAHRAYEALRAALGETHDELVSARSSPHPPASSRRRPKEKT